MLVKDVMTAPVSMCNSHDTLAIAAQRLWDGDCGAIPVVDDNQHLIGLITDRDICMCAYTRGLPLSDLVVHQAMCHKVFSCDPAQDISDVEAQMADKRIRRIPVVNGDNSPIGMVSLGDIVRHVVQDEVDDWFPSRSTILQTIAEISEPRVPVRS